MSKETPFPTLRDWEATRQTLHLYGRVLGVVPRTHAKPHPKWWHISLKVRPDGLTTDKMALPSGGEFWLKMDLRQHKVILSTDKGEAAEFSMTEGLTSTEFGDRVLSAVADLGLSGEYERRKFENDEPRVYNPKLVERYLTAVTNADRVFKEHRATLSGETSPVQLWPHNFDLAFEWYGTRVETYEEHGEIQEYPSQLNLGFYAGDADNEPYFYSNPWPFEGEELLVRPLPDGARWHTEGWEGTILPYSELAGDDNGAKRLLAYARTVYELASPTLLA